MSRNHKRARKPGNRNGRPIHSEVTRQKLLSSAGPIFAEKGYYAATIRGICKRAGANVAAVNYHFKDKLGLYAEVLNQCARVSHVEQMRAALDQTGSPEDILRDVIRARVQGLRSGAVPDWHLWLFAREITQPTPTMSRMINKVSRPIYDRLLDLVGKIIALPPAHEKTQLCANSIMGQILLHVFASPVLARLSPESKKMTPERLDQIANHIADFSLAYLREIGPDTGKPLISAIEVKHD